jgi:glycosyltransferase involved in cell wall biosynthesis
MTNGKKVTVVMCTYNGEKYIKEQLDSILNQTYPAYEIIIQDDGSTDQTWNIVQEYKQKFPVIQSYRNAENTGVDMNFKTAFTRATGDFIAPSDQDDIWYPQKIETLLHLIGGKMLAFSRSKIKYIDGTFGSYLPFTNCLESNIWKRVMAGHSCVFHKSMLPYIKLSESLNIVYDFAICLTGYALNSYIYSLEELQIWRRHESAYSKSVMSNGNVNYILKNVKGGGKFYRTFFTVKNLVRKNKSSGVCDYFGTLSVFLKRLKCKRHITKLCDAMARQTIYDYFVAGLICVIYGKKFFVVTDKLNFRKKLAFISYCFRYPFDFWYEHHKYEYL